MEVVVAPKVVLIAEAILGGTAYPFDAADRGAPAKVSRDQVEVARFYESQPGDGAVKLTLRTTVRLSSNWTISVA